MERPVSSDAVFVAHIALRAMLASLKSIMDPRVMHEFVYIKAVANNYIMLITVRVYSILSLYTDQTRVGYGKLLKETSRTVEVEVEEVEVEVEVEDDRRSYTRKR
jgi:hypothetical protein